jgi:hypothetical protein
MRYFALTSIPPFLLLLAVALGGGCSGRAPEGGINQPQAQLPDKTPSPESDRATADAELSEVSADEARVTVLSLFKKGSMKVFRTDLSVVSQAPPVPDTYKSLNATYKLESDAVFSDAAITIAVQNGEQVNFQDVRVLRLDPNDMYPGGFAWSNCTVLRDRKNFPGLGDAFFPDSTKRSVSCYFNETNDVSLQWYFTVVSVNGAARTTAATKIQMALASAALLEGGGGMRYVVNVKNAGPQDVAEVNFHSTFSMGVVLTDARPMVGECRPARYGSSDSSVVCFLGEMKKGHQIQVEFSAKPGREKPALDKKFNRGWVIRGFSRKGANDEVVPSDIFKFEPLAK